MENSQDGKGSRYHGKIDEKQELGEISKGKSWGRGARKCCPSNM